MKDIRYDLDCKCGHSERNLENRPDECPKCGKFPRFDRYEVTRHWKCNCGSKIEISGRDDTVTCGSCGQWFNAFGQEILPPDQWEDDNYDD